jgi:hypothetical protein
MHMLPKLLDTSIKDFNEICIIITDHIFIICQVPRKNVNNIPQYIIWLHTLRKPTNLLGGNFVQRSHPVSYRYHTSKINKEVL